MQEHGYQKVVIIRGLQIHKHIETSNQTCCPINQLPQILIHILGPMLYLFKQKIKKIIDLFIFFIQTPLMAQEALFLREPKKYPCPSFHIKISPTPTPVKSLKRQAMDSSRDKNLCPSACRKAHLSSSPRLCLVLPQHLHSTQNPRWRFKQP